MRICHVLTRLINGGADENTVLTCNHQAKNGHEVLLLHGPDTHPEILELVDGNVHRSIVPALHRSIHPFNDIRAYFQIKTALRAFSPQIVHTHTSKAGILGRLAAKNVGACKIVHGVHILPFLNVGFVQKQMYVILEKYVSRFTDKFICVSAALMEENVRHSIAPESTHAVVPSGMDVVRFKNAKPIDWKELLPERFHAHKDPKFIVYVGAIEKRKRHAEFIEVFETIREVQPNTILLFVGAGKKRATLDKAIVERGLESNVYITGFRADVERIIALADLCILASEREGLARVLIQYCLAGKPIVTTDLPGVETVVKNGVNGAVVQVNGLDAMAVPIIDLLSDEAKRSAYAAASQETDLSAWSVENMVRQIEAVYAEVT